MNFIKGFFDFFLPRICPCCNSKLDTEEEVLCDDCYSALHRVDDAVLTYEYRRKFAIHEHIEDFQSLFLFQSNMAFQNLIHELKYKKQFLIGNYLGRLINSELNEYIKSWEADLIIPVPLHQLKKAERGFNQSFYIAKSLSKETGIPVKHKLLKRVKYTQSQTKLNMEGRKANIEGVFKVKNPKEVKNKNIILLDDVITTGSTMNECAKTLQSKGAGEIFALSVALAGS